MATDVPHCRAARFVRQTVAMAGARRLRMPAWLVGRVERRLEAERATRTIDDFEMWDDVVVRVGDQPVYGTVIVVKNGHVTVREHGGSIEHRVTPDVVDPL